MPASSLFPLFFFSSTQNTFSPSLQVETLSRYSLNIKPGVPQFFCKPRPSLQPRLFPPPAIRAFPSQQGLDTFHQVIAFQVELLARLPLQQGGDPAGVRDDHHAKTGGGLPRHGQADTVEGHGTFVNYVFPEFRRDPDLENNGVPLFLLFQQAAPAVNMPGDQMAAQPVTKPERRLQVDPVARAEASQGGPA